MSNYYKRILQPPDGSFFLFGLRGTGKSSWIRSHFKNAYSFDLLDEALYLSLLAQPGLFKNQISAFSSGSWVVVDEVQRIPALLNYVHQAIEKQKLKFVLCGSSARQLKRAGTNLLAGRAVTLNMHPLMPEELGHDFDLEAALQWGTLPIIWGAENRKARLISYVQTYVQSEVKAEGLVRDLSGFLRFLPVAAIFHGQTVNVSSLARDAAVARNTVEGYFEVLEDTLLGYFLPAFSPKLRVKETKHPKWYWADAGVVRASKKQLGPLALEERGAVFEGWIAGLLRAYGSYRDLFDEWFYWAPTEAKKTEVDFLLRRNQSFVAIECKAASRFRPDMLDGLQAIAGLKGLKRRILVYTGDAVMRTDEGIDILPIRDFLKTLEEDKIW